MSRSGYWSFFAIQLRPWKSTQSQREPSFVWMKRTRAHGESERDRLNPVARFFINELMQGHKFLLGQGVNRTIGWGSAFIQSDLVIILVDGQLVCQPLDY